MPGLTFRLGEQHRTTIARPSGRESLRRTLHARVGQRPPSPSREGEHRSRGLRPPPSCLVAAVRRLVRALLAHKMACRPSQPCPFRTGPRSRVPDKKCCSSLSWLVRRASAVERISLWDRQSSIRVSANDDRDPRRSRWLARQPDPEAWTIHRHTSALRLTAGAAQPGGVHGRLPHALHLRRRQPSRGGSSAASCASDDVVATPGRE